MLLSCNSEVSKEFIILVVWIWYKKMVERVGEVCYVS